MIADVLAVIVLILASELWLPLAFLFGAIKLVTTFSLGVAWAAFKSVPIFIWDFIHTAAS